MSRIIVTLAVDDVVGADPMGIKETVAMALEPLGQVRVLRVDIAQPEQTTLFLPNKITNRKDALYAGKNYTI